MSANTWATQGQLSLIEDPLETRFRTYHHENPHVLRALTDLAYQWRGAGHTRCAIEMLFAHLRWESGIETGTDQFKLNNSYRSRYARLIMLLNPDLDGFFELRILNEEKECA